VSAVAQTVAEPSNCIEQTVPMPGAGAPVLAMGAWFKNTLCIASNRQAHLSPVVGDLDCAETCRAHEQMAYALLEVLGEKPSCIVHDLHPDFHSSRFAAALGADLQTPLLAVQHHHAHIAAVAAEHDVTEPVIGLALDGVGLGSDGMAWGGELLYAHGSRCQRLGHLHPLPLPGGDRAAREPWRMAAAALHELGRNAEIAQRFSTQPGAQMVAGMLQRGLNCPGSSSTGRLFDAASGLLGLSVKMEFEAQAAMLLERQASQFGPAAPLENGYRLAEDGVLDFRALLAALADCQDAAYGAALFHATLAAGLAAWASAAAQARGVSTVALGGGCFLNKVLTGMLEPALTARNLRVLRPRQLSPGDSAISLGQAWVAVQQLKGH
jgi:hydrogenase maturation protein HypF